MARTNIDLDERLVQEGLRRLKCRSKRELVHLALSQLVQGERRKDLLGLAGRVQWQGDLRNWRAD